MTLDLNAAHTAADLHGHRFVPVQLGGDADDLADVLGLAQHDEHVVSDVRARNGPAAANVASDGGPVGAGERLVELARPGDAGEDFRARGPVRSRVSPIRSGQVLTGSDPGPPGDSPGAGVLPTTGVIQVIDGRCSS